MAQSTNAYMIQMSNQSGDGITDVRAKACDILLDHRLTQKAKDPKKAEAIMDKLHVAQPKKRDNKVREVTIPDTVLQGVKKTGPTIKELQEEYGGAGRFYIPEEEHYMLEKEDWRYDKWPEFYQGKNVADFYDADIEAKLNALEEEEEKILALEAENDAMDDGSDDDSEEDGITMENLTKSVAEVRIKCNIIRQRSFLKARRRANSKIRNLDEFTADLKAKGIDVNEASLATRAKTRRTIDSLEAGQRAREKAVLGESDSDDDDRELLDDKDMAMEEQEGRGRRGREEIRLERKMDAKSKEKRNNKSIEKKKEKKKLLGKRARDTDGDVDMDGDVSDGATPVPQGVRVKGSDSQKKRAYTPE